MVIPESGREPLKRISNLKLLKRLPVSDRGLPCPHPLILPIACWPPGEGSQKLASSGARSKDMG